jgi:isopenicillin N synthase-like dioxygenase
MPGEIIWLLSGGRIPPLFHRVNPKPSCEERIALLFFGDINPSACEPWVENEFNRGVDIGRRVLTSVNRFGLKGFGEE